MDVPLTVKDLTFTPMEVVLSVRKLGTLGQQ